MRATHLTLRKIHCQAASHLFLSLPAIWRKWAFYLDRATSCLAFYRLFIVIHLLYFFVTQKFISLLIHLYLLLLCVLSRARRRYIYDTVYWLFHRSSAPLERRIQLFFIFLVSVVTNKTFYSPLIILTGLMLEDGFLNKLHNWVESVCFSLGERQIFSSYLRFKHSHGVCCVLVWRRVSWSWLWILPRNLSIRLHVACNVKS